MDWSLVDPYAHNRFLRDHLAFKHVWLYYIAMIIDPILRFNWIFYAIYAEDLQHSAILSFIISLSEVFRRGMWVIIRVENEHCTNVGRFRASRDVPLPYKMKKPHDVQVEDDGALNALNEEDEEDDARIEEQRRQGISISSAQSRTTGREELERIQTQDTTSTRRRHQYTPRISAMKRVGSILHMAHAQDFERKKRPTGVEENDGKGGESSEEGTEPGEEEEDEAMADDIVEADEPSEGREGREEGNVDGVGERDFRFAEHQHVRSEVEEEGMSPGEESGMVKRKKKTAFKKADV